MNIRRYIPHIRTAAYALVGVTAGTFVATGMAALAFGYVPPRLLQLSSTAIGYAGIFAVVVVIFLDRRLFNRRA